MILPPEDRRYGKENNCSFFGHAASMEAVMTNSIVPAIKVLAVYAAVFGIDCTRGTQGPSSHGASDRTPIGEAPAPCGEGSAPELSLINGIIFTADPKHLRAEAIAVAGEHVCAVGTTEEIRRLSKATTRVIDLGGKLVIPGLNDAHVHEPRLFRTTPVDTRGADAPGDLIRRVAAEAKKHPTGTWLRGELPLALLDVPGIERATLDAEIPNHPVLLSTLGGHAAVLNSAGLRAFGITDSSPRSARGTYGKDASGRSNGWLFEYAFSSRDAGFAFTNEQIGEAADRFAAEATRFGITSVQTMAIDVPAERLASVLAERDSLLRWRVIRFPRGELPVLPRVVHPAPLDAKVRLLGVKYILDGTPIERGAAMKGGYADKPDKPTTLNFSEDEIGQMLASARTSGEQLLLHVAGDAALEVILRQMKRQGGLASFGPLRVRFEHGDGVTPDLYGALREAGIVVVQNPTHFTLTELFRVRFGGRRVASFQPLASMAAAGIPIALGSDGALNPFLNIMLATLHPTRPEEAFTREQAVIAYTRGAAYAELADDVKGTLAKGMLADMAVLSRNIFEIPADQLPSTASVLTIVGGKVVYESSGH
jgi:predicted amidohydrolase YtcJ